MNRGALPPFSISVTVLGPDHATVLVSGEIDMDTGPRIEDALVDQLEGGKVRLGVDLGDVGFMDSSGIHMLLRVQRLAHDAGGRMDLLAAGPRVVRLLEVTGLTELLPVPRTAEHDLRSRVAAAQGALCGSWSWDVLEDAWWWSPEMFEIFGLAPDSVTPTTSLLLSFRHPEDIRDAETVLAAARRGGEPFAYRHRLRLPDGNERTVVSVGEPESDRCGRPVRVTGFVLDVTGMPGLVA